MSRLILPRRRLLLAAPALILPHRRADAQGGMMPGPGTPHTTVAPWTLISSVTAGGGSSPLTTPAINTTGANLLIYMCSFFGQFNTPNTPTDSKGNTWTAGPTVLSGATGFSGAHTNYALSPTVGTGHTFSVSWSGTIFPAIIVYAFKSATGTPFYDFASGTEQSIASVTSGTTVSVPSVVASHANDLVLSCLADSTVATYTIDNGFTISVQVPNNGVDADGAAIAWKIVNPSSISATWTLSASTVGASSANFVMGSV